MVKLEATQTTALQKLSAGLVDRRMAVIPKSSLLRLIRTVYCQKSGFCYIYKRYLYKEVPQSRKGLGLPNYIELTSG